MHFWLKLPIKRHSTHTLKTMRMNAARAKTPARLFTAVIKSWDAFLRPTDRVHKVSSR